jgi:hypothetical protein
VLGLLTFYLALRYIFSIWVEDAEDGPGAIEGHQDVVLVTVFNNKLMSEDYMRMVTANREDYAARHGRCDTIDDRQDAKISRIQELLHQHICLQRSC